MQLRSALHHRATAAALVAAMLGLASCADDDADDADDAGDGAPTTSAAATTEPGSDETGDPSATSTSATRDAEETAPDAGATPTTTVPTRPTTPAGETTPLGEPDVTFTQLGEERANLLDIDAAPDDGLYLVFQDGTIELTDDEGGDGVIALDISDVTEASNERGLLGLALHPDGRLAYINYTNATENHDTFLVEYEIADDGTFVADSARTVITVEQPHENHNGGDMSFGPDDHLYVALGDGGSAGDPDRLALDVSSPLGTLLRIDPSGAGEGGGRGGELVPSDNPFADEPDARGEIWSIGLRNPWRFTFDEPTGDLWIADVGQDAIEEINVARAGDDGLGAGRGVNFGWSAYEGDRQFNDDQLDAADDHRGPRYTYENDGARCSISGAATYHGERIADLAGGFVFADFCSGEVWALPLGDGDRTVPLGEVPSPVSVREAHGELYVASLTSGLFRADPA